MHFCECLLRQAGLHLEYRLFHLTQMHGVLSELSSLTDLCCSRLCTLPVQEFYTPPRAGATAVPGPERATSPDPDTPITRPNFRDPRPISVPFAGGTKALDERGLLRRAESPRSKVGDVVRTGEECQGCGKRVYAAEVVHAIGHK